MSEDKVPYETENKIQNETRIDDFAVSMFAAMGFKERLSDATVNIYKAFKKYKDKISPGRLSPEGFAFVCTMADMVEHKIDLDNGKAEKTKKPKE